MRRAVAGDDAGEVAHVRRIEIERRAVIVRNYAARFLQNGCWPARIPLPRFIADMDVSMCLGFGNQANFQPYAARTLFACYAKFAAHAVYAGTVM